LKISTVLYCVVSECEGVIKTVSLNHSLAYLES